MDIDPNDFQAESKSIKLISNTYFESDRHICCEFTMPINITVASEYQPHVKIAMELIESAIEEHNEKMRAEWKLRQDDANEFWRRIEAFKRKHDIKEYGI